MIRPMLVTASLVALLAAPPTFAEAVAGTWSASVSRAQPERMHLSLSTRRDNQMGNTFDREVFTGLTQEQVFSTSHTPVRFALQREAGVVTFEGTFRDGIGTGEFAFEPHREYPRTLRSLGVSLADKEDEDQQLFQLAMFDVSSAFIRSMQAIGYREPLEMYEQFRIFDVNPGYVRDMAAVGFDHLSASKLVETRIHGATPEYIRTMRAAGDDLTLDKYIESRIFQITPEFRSEMSRAGYHDLNRDVLTQFRIHGVTTAFIQELRDLGYDRVPAQQLVEMRIHGVTPDFIRRVGRAGYRHVPVEKLVQMRIFDIDPEIVKALDESTR